MKIMPLVKETYQGWNKHDAPKIGASLAYYTILSLAPLVIFVIGLVGLVLGQGEARDSLLSQVRDLIGPDGARVVKGMIEQARQPAHGAIATALGFITLLLGASGVFGELRDALNTMWDVKRSESGGIWAMVRQRFLSFGMVLGIGFLLLVSLILSAAVSIIGKFFSSVLPIPESVLHLINLAVSLLVGTILFAAIYRFLPDRKIAWRDLWVGAFVTAILFDVGKLLIGLYLGKASVGSAYGAAGSLVIVLVWVYYSAQVFLFGAEFTHVYALRCGTASREQPHDAPASVETAVPPPAAAPEIRSTEKGAAVHLAHAVSTPTVQASALSAALVAALAALGWWKSRKLG